MALQSINLADGRLMRESPEHQPHELELIAQQAHRSFLSWRESSFVKRAAAMQEAARQLRERSPEWAIPSYRTPRSAPWRGTICARSCTARSSRVSHRARSCLSAA